jgi:TrmH family RNA methyltransferase
MGAHFRVPILASSWAEIASRLRSQQVYLAAAQQGVSYTQADFRSSLALIVGGEAAGAGLQAQDLAKRYVHIPMPGGSESLNAAVAAGILLFEVLRQRSGKI